MLQSRVGLAFFGWDVNLIPFSSSIAFCLLHKRQKMILYAIATRKIPLKREFDAGIRYRSEIVQITLDLSMARSIAKIWQKEAFGWGKEVEVQTWENGELTGTVPIEEEIDG